MLSLDVQIPDLDEALNGVYKNLEGASTRAMRRTERGLTLDLRSDVTAAGMSTRLANTWRGKTYPERESSLTPAAFVFSKAPEIIRAFDEAPIIRPLGGKRFLWIPTKAVPRDARTVVRPGRKRPTQASATRVEEIFNQDLFIQKWRRGISLAFVNGVQGRRGGVARPATPGRLRRGRQSQRILMFVLVPFVKPVKRFDRLETALKWAGLFGPIFREELR